jgi:hypothetical protein
MDIKQALEIANAEHPEWDKVSLAKATKVLAEEVERQEAEQPEERHRLMPVWDWIDWYDLAKALWIIAVIVLFAATVLGASAGLAWKLFVSVQA